MQNVEEFLKEERNGSIGQYFLGCSGFRKGDWDKRSSIESWSSQKHSYQYLHAFTDESPVELQEMLQCERVADYRKEKCMFP